MMSEFEKMINGLLYDANDHNLKSLSNKAREFMDLFNETKYNDFDLRQALVENQFKSVGVNAKINKPLHVDYGSNITLGDNFYANFNTTLLDVAEIIIGNNVLFAPNVSVFTATHPIDPEARNSGLEYGLKVVIGDNVWIGGNTVINPGVNIGNNVVIGSGSVVVSDIPDNMVAYGNPAKPKRLINNQDKQDFLNQLKLINK